MQKNDEIIQYADSIISRNKCVAIAYDAKANEAYEQGDIQTMIEYKWNAVKYAPYSIEEYEDFCLKLISVIEPYRTMGDEASAEFCEKTIIEIKDRLEEVEKNTSSFGWKIKNKPEFQLSEECNEYIERITR